MNDVSDAVEPILLFHETGGHEGDGSDEALARARTAIEAMKAKEEAADQLTDEDKDELYELAKEQAPEILSDQPPADDVERVARAIAAAQYPDELPFGNLSPETQLEYRNAAIAAIAAIRNSDEGMGS